MIINSGKINKLTFMGFIDEKFKKPLYAPPYSVMINPESFKRGLSIAYDEKQPPGADSSSGKIKNVKQETYSFEFIVDGTGVADSIKEPVCSNIERFLLVVYSYNSDSHRTPYVMIEYCGNIMRCVLKSLDINYTLFNPDGTPLRAKISCSFNSVMSPLLSAIIKDKRSPDLSHTHFMKEDETLIALANDIYNSNLYYIDVAEKNHLNNFRKIKQGTEIYFPPLKN